MPAIYHVVDLFAGPGGLAEGFEPVGSPLSQRRARIALSVEKEASAHRTLRLRSFLRQFGARLPREYYEFLNGDPANLSTLESTLAAGYPKQWARAEDDAWHFEMAKTPEVRSVFIERLKAIRAQHKNETIVIGGPPCQAYSLVGRARNKGIESYSPENDVRHVLYQEYISALETLHPAAFVMENVKGLLSSKLNGDPIIHRIIKDLSSVGDGYELLTMTPPPAFSA